MKKSRNGKLIISLDFEKMWGIHDSCLWEEKIVYIKNVNIIVPKLLELFNKYEISATWATVGMLFFNNKKELLDFTNNIEFPTYDNLNFSPYLHFDKIKDDDEVSFANDLIKKIMSVPNQEIGSHTFSHYYCGESGQNPKQFKQDLDLSLKISKINNLSVTSLVFPKNQYNNEYIKIAKECGIKAYRGLESSWINKLKNKKLRRLLLFISSYLPITRKECYNINDVKKIKPYNIKSSFFFRAATKNKFLEFLKIKRVKALMRKSAKKGLVFHIWFHPHNLSNNIDLGIKQVEEILKYYSILSAKYNFKSYNMKKITEVIEQ